MADTVEEFSTTGTIQRVDVDDALSAILGGGSIGGDLPPGQYQIGPYIVTPSNDQSGMLQYVVRMQDALQEAVQTLHEKEVKINQLSQQVSQLTIEKNHVTSKLNAITRTVQDKDQRMRQATHDVRDLEAKYESLEKEDTRKAATVARKQLSTCKKELAELKKSHKELKEQLKAAQDEKAPLEIKCAALEDDLHTSAGRYKSLEEQRVAAQEQVSALTWKLQAFEQQYAALYQQYAASIRADSPIQEGDIPRSLPSVEPAPPPPAHTFTSVDLIHQEEAPNVSEKAPLMSESCKQCGSSGSGKTRIGGTIHRRRQTFPIWLPERLVTALSLRSAPRIKMFFSVYLLFIHLYLIFFCLLES